MALNECRWCKDKMMYVIPIMFGNEIQTVCFKCFKKKVIKGKIKLVSEIEG